MQTQLDPRYQDTPDGRAAEAILRKCVHCGFCTATCPTYQLLGDELDGPRGRIYLIKQVLEGAQPTTATQGHLDRCLTCRNCETTCPSGVQYGQLVEIGRRIVDEQVPRPAAEQRVRWLLKEGLTSPLIKPAMAAGRLVRPLLPAVLKDKLPPKVPASAHRWPQRTHARKVIMMLGCVQPAMMPNINSATARVLDAAGIQTLVADEAGCCGAIRTHLNDHDGGIADMKRAVDALWPALNRGEAEAVVMNASGCGAMVQDYGRALAHIPEYAERAAQVSAACKDLSQFLPDIVERLAPRLKWVPSKGEPPRLAFHPPCTLQHAMKLRGGVETAFRSLGLDIALPAESHLCCGSAGTYSVLQPVLSKALRERKLVALNELKPAAILSANIGCIQHLQSGTGVPVMHWVEWLDQQLTAGGLG